MPEISINLNGIHKLLSNLHPDLWDPDKAAGPDEMKHIVLKELRNEISPNIKLLFEESLAAGQIPSDWTKVNVSPLFKQATSVTLQIIGPSPWHVFYAGEGAYNCFKSYSTFQQSQCIIRSPAWVQAKTIMWDANSSN